MCVCMCVRVCVIVCMCVCMIRRIRLGNRRIPFIKPVQITKLKECTHNGIDGLFQINHSASMKNEKKFTPFKLTI